MSIILKNVDIYNGKKGTTLHNVDIEFEAGKVYGVHCDMLDGKKPFMDVLLGCETVENGEVVYNGEQLYQIDLPKYRSTVGVVYYEESLLQNYSAIDNVVIAMEIAQISEEHKKMFALALLEKYGFNKKDANHPVRKLTHKDRKIIEIVRALSKDPKIIIIDNVLAQLDEEKRLLFIEELKMLAHQKQKCIILFDHDHFLENVADELWAMKNGYLNFIR